MLRGTGAPGMVFWSFSLHIPIQGASLDIQDIH
jgi:hypothetical protein